MSKGAADEFSGDRMSDQFAPHDDLFTPSLAGSVDDRDAPFNIGYALVPGLLGGPIAVTVALLVSAYRLRAGRLVLVAIAAAGVLALVGAMVLITRDPDIGGSAFRYAALGAYLAQGALVVRRFRSWSLRGRDTSPFIVPGLALTALGAVVDGVCVAVLGVA